jgi:hypothetical protein
VRNRCQDLRYGSGRVARDVMRVCGSACCSSAGTEGSGAVWQQQRHAVGLGVRVGMM